jgi:predicted TIM-barrel fold metal-dependent hydrolase
VFDLLRDVVGLDRIVFGSDYPQVPDSYVEASVRTLASSPTLDDHARTQIGRANGEKLLNRRRDFIRN